MSKLPQKREVEQVLKQRDKNSKERTALAVQRTKRLSKLQNEIKADQAPAYAALDKSDAGIADHLKLLNPYQPGTYLRGVAPDGLPGRVTYQVTMVIDHQSLMARRVTAKGVLSADGADKFTAEKRSYYSSSIHNLNTYKAVATPTHIITPLKRRGDR